MTRSVHVRTCAANDLAAVALLIRRSYETTMAASYTPALFERALPMLVRVKPDLVTSGRFYVAADESGSIVACGGWSGPAPQQETQAEIDTGHLRHFATSPDRMREGFGRAVLTRSVADAVSAGVTRLHCDASRGAVPFYRALGFAPLGERTIRIGPDLDLAVVKMILMISPARQEKRDNLD
jgi:GNAT superfamily N-acetyltransferase